MFDGDDPETIRDFPADVGTAEDTLRRLVTVRDRYPRVSESVARAVDALLGEVEGDEDIEVIHNPPCPLPFLFFLPHLDEIST